MNITFLAGYFTPEKSADTHLNDDLVRDFSLYGANINVLVPFPSRGLDGEQVKQYSKLKSEKINERLVVHRVGGKHRFQKGLLARGLSFVWKSWALYRESKKYKTDCFFLVSTPPTLGYLAIKLSKKAPVIYKLQDIFPDNIINLKKWKESSLLVKILRKLERNVYSSVSEILVCSNDVKETIVSRGVDEKKVTVLHDWIDKDSCVPVDRLDNPLFDEYGVCRDSFIFVYAGNMGHMQNLDTILDAAHIINKQETNIKIVLIGDGACKLHIEHRIHDEQLDNVVMLPMQPLEKISMAYSLGDVGLVSLKPNVAKTALPSKTWSIMSAARPVLCEIDLNSELAGIIEAESLGYCVHPGDAKGMAETMLKMYQTERSQLTDMGKRCREYVAYELDRKKITQKYFDQVKELIPE